MNALLGFEESQATTNELRILGVEAFSCDLQECSGGHPEYHLQMDIFQALKLRKWDLIILHPPCTYTALCGNRWYYNSPLRIEGIKLCNNSWTLACDVCDNGETKETWLWLKGLPLLEPTNIVDGRENRIWKMPPSADRSKIRSKTYPGIAQAMAFQWSEYILKQKAA